MPEFVLQLYACAGDKKKKKKKQLRSGVATKPHF